MIVAQMNNMTVLARIIRSAIPAGLLFDSRSIRGRPFSKNNTVEAINPIRREKDKNGCRILIAIKVTGGIQTIKIATMRTPCQNKTNNKPVRTITMVYNQ